MGIDTATHAMVAVVVFVVVYVPKLKVPIDALVLSLPVIGRARRELALSRFFHVFNLLYSTGGMRVEHMITLAASVVTNLAVPQMSGVPNSLTDTESSAANEMRRTEARQVVSGGTCGESRNAR